MPAAVTRRPYPRGVRMEDLLGEDGDQDRILKPEPTHHPEEHEQVAKRRLAAHVVEAGEKTREPGSAWLGGSTAAVVTPGSEGEHAPAPAPDGHAVTDGLVHP